MTRFLVLFLLFSWGKGMSQEEIVHSVYFDFDKAEVNEKQVKDMVAFVKGTDSTRIESIQIYGYTDDVGKEDYNFKLSTKRAGTIQTKLVETELPTKLL